MDVSKPSDVYQKCIFSFIDRPLLKSVLRKLKWSDDMAKSNATLREKHIKWIKLMKYLGFGFLVFNTLQAVFLYLPARLDTNNDFGMTRCIGKISDMLIK